MFRCFFYKSSLLLHSKFHMLKNNSFSLTQQKHSSWIYLDIAAFQDFKISLLLPHAREEFVRVYHDRKVKENNELKCKFEFRLNCKQRLMCHQGKINDIKFKSIDAAQFCLCRISTNCLSNCL